MSLSQARLERLEHLDGGAHVCGSARISVACPPCVAMTRRMSAAPASVVAGTSSQTSPPDQS